MRWAITILVLVLLAGSASASDPAMLERGETLVTQQVSCADLSDEDLAAIGEYLMEQRHPGEAHEYMDQLMFGDDEEAEEAFHIALSQRWYCNDSAYEQYGMMGAYGQRGFGMMGGSYGSMMSWAPFGMQSAGWTAWLWVNRILGTLLLITLILLAFVLIDRFSSRRKQMRQR